MKKSFKTKFWIDTIVNAMKKIWVAKVFKNEVLKYLQARLEIIELLWINDIDLVKLNIEISTPLSFPRLKPRLQCLSISTRGQNVDGHISESPIPSLRRKNFDFRRSDYFKRIVKRVYCQFISTPLSFPRLEPQV